MSTYFSIENIFLRLINSILYKYYLLDFDFNEYLLKITTKCKCSTF